MCVYDKNGTELKVGDWILYPWWTGHKTELLFGTIKRISGINSLRVHPSTSGISTPSLTEKLPSDKKEREQIILLRKFEQ